MFGKRSNVATHPTTTEFLESLEVPAKPDDSELPEIPPTKTWFVENFSHARNLFSGTDLEMGAKWISITRVTGYEWKYDGFQNTWRAQSTRELVASVRTEGVYAFGLVEQ